MSSKILQANLREQENLVLMDLVGEISAPSEETLNQVMEAARLTNPTALILNFSGVDYINSTGIALILNLSVKAGRSHLRLFAYGLSEHYNKIFRITRLSDFMRIFNNEADALASAESTNSSMVSE